MRLDRPYLIYPILLLATIATVVFYLMNRAVDITHHNRTVELLHQIKQLDTQLDRDVLQIKAFRLDHYDGFTETEQAILRLQARLKDPRSSLVGAFGPGFDGAAALYLEAAQDKLELIERIKSVSAILRSSLIYLPGEIERVAARLPGAGRNELSALSAKLLKLYVFHDVEDMVSLREVDQRLGAMDWPDAQAESVRQIVAHLRAILPLMERIRQLMDRYFAIEAGERLDGLYRLYAEFYAARSRRADIVALFLLGLVVALFAGGAISLRALARAKVEAEIGWNKLRDAIESIDEGFALYDNANRLVLWNTNFARTYAVVASWLQPGLPFRRLVRVQIENGQYRLDEPANAWFRRRVRAHKQGERRQVERLLDGVSLLVSDYKTSDGGTATIVTDITGRLQIEQHLRQLSQAVEQSPVSVVITDTQGRISYVNRKFVEVTGYSAAEVVGENPRLLKERGIAGEEYGGLWDAITHGRDWRGEFHNRRKDGASYWESATISPLRDERGEITHFIAIKEDITRRKQAEEQLHLAAVVFETTSEGILVTDAENRIIAVNPAFTHITGYGADEVLGRTPRLLRSGRQDSTFYQGMWEQLGAGRRWAGEIQNRRKEGRVYPEWLSISPVMEPGGRVRHYVAVFSDITERKEAEERIRWQANYDVLTQLPNRTLFFDRLGQAIANAHREQWYTALLFLDLDRFKVINDTLGHAAGDALLREVAHRLQPLVRENDTLARLGGDEFTLILQDVLREADAALVAERVIAELSRPFSLAGLEGLEAYVGVTIGIAIYPSDAADGATLLRNADLAMYKAKSSGRNQFQFYTQSMNDEILARNRLEHDLHRAVEYGEFVTFFQPIIEVASGRIYGAEALIRWNHPSRGMLLPGEFITLAEEVGLIGSIGEWVFRDACDQAAGWRREGKPTCQISINLSNQQRRQGLDGARLAAILAEVGLPPECVTLELTESMVLEDSDEALRWLTDIKSTGITLSIDDFGTGYSSLSYLQRLPFDNLKIDKSFIQPLEEGSDDSLVQAILAIARSLGMQVVAEGVENEHQFRYLKAQGCDLVQGFYFSRPLRGAEFLDYLSRWG